MCGERTIKYNKATHAKKKRVQYEGRPPQKITPVALDSGAPSLQPVTADAQALVSPVAAAAAAVGGAAPRLASPPSTAARLWQSSPPPPRPLCSAATVRNAAAAALAATPARRLRALQQGHGDLTTTGSRCRCGCKRRRGRGGLHGGGAARGARWRRAAVARACAGTARRAVCRAVLECEMQPGFGLGTSIQGTC